MQDSCSVVVVVVIVVVVAAAADIALLSSFATEAESAKGIRARRISFMVDNLNLLLALEVFFDWQVLLKFSFAP